MFDITFGIGPSKINTETYQDMRGFHEKKYGEISHRSADFSTISQKASEQLRAYFELPPNYQMVWGSSATEMMELVIKSVVKQNSFHFTCGSFSERWHQIAKNLGKNAQGQVSEWGQPNDYKNTQIPANTELITVTQSETSTGVGVSDEKIRDLRARHPESLIAIDITSIGGAVAVDIAQADAWLFSVQKCFGLPAGLGVLIYNDRFLAKAKTVPTPMGVINLPDMHTKMSEDFFTIQTPNVMGVYLLGNQLERWNHDGGAAQHDEETKAKTEIITDAIDHLPGIEFLVPDIDNRSPSIQCLCGDEAIIQKIHKLTRLHNIRLGGGYGKFKNTTLRIANFPNVTVNDTERLHEVLTKHWH